MSKENCPYCQVIDDVYGKKVYKAERIMSDGQCPDCGAFIDAGQHSVKVNGYEEIFKGSIKLLNDMVDYFNEILDYCDIDLRDYFDDEDGAEITLHTNEILERLFVPNYGGTTVCNFKRALGIKDNYITFKLQEREDEDEE